MEPDTEPVLRALLQDHQYDKVATLAIEAYGDDVYGYLIGTLKNPGDAADVFSQTIEDFWRGLPRFRGEARLLTWFYRLAQNAASRFRRSPWNRGDRSSDSTLGELAAAVRSRTDPWRRTDVKDQLRALRDALPPDDRAMLILRVDRGLAWNEVALVMLERDDASPAAIAREAARLRKRFEHVCKELRARAHTAGIVDAGS